MNLLTLIIFFFYANLCFAQFHIGGPPLVENQEAVFKARLKEVEAHIKEQRKKGKYNILGETTETSDCSHCPAHLKLVGSVNQVLEKMQGRVDIRNSSPKLPHQIQKLKFLYYSVKSKDLDGQIKCQNVGFQPFIYPHQRMNGEFEFAFEDVFQYDTVDGLTLYSPSGEETVYYYRGDGDEKDLIIEARVGRDRTTKFKFYKYYPSLKELKERNLPDFSYVPSPALGEDKLPPKVTDESQREDSSQQASSGTKFKVNLDPKIEMRNKIIPKDFKIGTANFSQVITDEMSFEAETELSLAKGNRAKFQINQNGKAEGSLELTTMLNGQTKYAATVPYEIKVLDGVFENSSYKARGAISERSDGRALSLYLTDDQVELIRADVAQDKTTGKSSVIVTKKMVIDPKTQVDLQAGAGSNSTFVSAKHSTVIRRDVSAVLDIRYDVDKKASLFYTINAKF